MLTKATSWPERRSPTRTHRRHVRVVGRTMSDPRTGWYLGCVAPWDDVVNAVRRAQAPIAVRRWRNRPYVSRLDAIVLGGCGRSGTTLLRVMLDSHPRICCGPEVALYLPRPVTRGRIRQLAWLFDLGVDEITAMRRVSDSQAQFIEAFALRYCEARGKARFAEKTPRNVLVLEYLLSRFPRATFIHVIRDGRDVVCSLRTHPRYQLVDGVPSPLHTWNPIAQCADRWVSDTSAGLAYRDHPRVAEVRYEDLVLRPEETLRPLLDRLGEPWDDHTLDTSGSGPSRDPARFPQNPEATGTPYASRLGGGGPPSVPPTPISSRPARDGSWWTSDTRRTHLGAAAASERRRVGARVPAHDAAAIVAVHAFSPRARQRPSRADGVAEHSRRSDQLLRSRVEPEHRDMIASHLQPPPRAAAAKTRPLRPPVGAWIEFP